MWAVWIRDQTAHFVKSDLDLHCSQKLLVSSTLRNELLSYHCGCNCTFPHTTKQFGIRKIAPLRNHSEIAL